MSDAGTSADWVAGLLHSADSFYPTGSYAHSFGLEGLAQAGVVHDRATLRTFLLEHVLPPLARTDLPVAARVWTAAGAAPPDWATLRELCFLGSALRGAREPREASEAIGRQRLEFAAMLHGGIAAEFNQRAIAEGWPRPACVAAAIEGRVLGAPRDAVLSALIYAAAAGMMSASVKLLRLGQNAVHTLLVEVLAQTPALIAEAVALELVDVGAFNPWWDIAAARHEHADFRLFIS
jgi:urease accessory protein